MGELVKNIMRGERIINSMEIFFFKIKVPFKKNFTQKKTRGALYGG